MDRPLLLWLPAFVIAATVIYTFSTYPALPERIPTHFGINGQPSGWSSREFGAWLLPAVMVLVWLPSLLVPKPALGIVITAMLAFQAIVQYMVLSIAQGHAVDINRVIYVGVAVLLAICVAAIRPIMGRNSQR